MGIKQTASVGLVLGLFSLALAGTMAAAGSPPNLGETLAAQLDLVAEQPHDAEAHNDLGNLLVLDGRYQEAEEAYAKAIELAPENTLPRFNLGMLLQQIGRSRDAVQEFRSLLEIDDHHARTYYQLGMLHEARKQRSAALEHYARAFALDPDLTFPRHNPHIIDNRLATEAMLMSRRFYESPSSDMPRLYGEPERIAELMLEGMRDASEPEGADPLPEEPELEPGAPAAEDPLERTPGAGRGARPEILEEEDDEPDARSRDEEDDDEEDSDEEDSDEEDRRQLTHADLEAGSTVGQARTQGGAVTRQRPSTRAGTGRSTVSVRERILQQRREAAGPSGQPTATDRAPSARPRYRPASRFSTGRLELRLLPEESEEGVTGRLSK